MEESDRNEELAPALVVGAIAGIVATMAMTVAAANWFRLLPAQDQYPLPPREITDQISRHLLGARLGKQGAVAATLISHFAFGAAAGALYWAPFRSRTPSMGSSIAYGLAVWTASYFGWVPAFGLLRSADSHPPRRSILMIAAHAVWAFILWVGGSALAHSLGPLRKGPLLDAPESANALVAGEPK